MTYEQIQSAIKSAARTERDVGRFQGEEWSVELLRGVAALMVMYAHYHVLGGVGTNLLSFAFTGVDLFFVISGFVFAPYFFGKTLQLTPFLIRRFFRIYPLYAFALCLYGLLRYFKGQGVDHFVSHLFFLHTLESKEVAFYFNPAFWSLPPEVEFYLFLPLLCAVFPGSARVAGLACLALVAHLALVSGMIWAAGWVRFCETALFHLPGLMIEFALGILAWRVAVSRPRAAFRVALMLGGGALWLVLARIFQDGGDAAIDRLWWLRGNVGVLAALSYALMVVAVVGVATRPPAAVRILAVRLGNLSFGVYLFHNLMPSALAPMKGGVSAPMFALLCAAATFALAGLMYRFYEGPLREIGRELAGRRSTSPR